MLDPPGYQFLADVVLTLHVGVVLFVVGGLLLVWWGNWRHWCWVNTGWFRGLHLATMIFVAAQAWLGLTCPLTTLEMWLRKQANTPSYESSFIEHWLEALLFWNVPTWVFTSVYTVFAIAVAITWWRFPPHRWQGGHP